MDLNSSNRNIFYGDLDDIFTRVLSADTIRGLYESFFHEVKQRPLPKKKARKADMTAALINLAENPRDLQLFVKTLPKEVYKAYGLLVWQESLPADEAEKALGFALTNQSEHRNHWQLGGHAIHPNFPFIALFARSGHYGYGERGLDAFLVSMPPAVRKWLKPCFPKPKGYDIEPFSEESLVAAKNDRFDASPSITADLGQLADFLKRGTVARTKRGDFAKTSIRKASDLTESSEWYPAEKGTSRLALMRHEMLLDFIEGFDGGIIKELTAAEVKGAVFRRILKALQKDEDILAKWLMLHLKHRKKYYEETFKAEGIAGLFGLFECLPINTWVRTDNLKSVQYYQEVTTCFFYPPKYTFRSFTSSTEYKYEAEFDLTHENLQQVAIDPLIDGMAFILSAFGLVELAYQAPKNEKFNTKKAPYLTPFDGALAARLTDIGAYAFGLTSKLELKQSSRKVATLRLHPEQLHVMCSDLDPITELTLKEFMECIGPEFYRMTRATILKGCQTPKDVQARVKDFRQRILAELPPNWEAFLTSLETEKSALLQERGLSIFSLADRPELKRHFMQDPVLRQRSLRVEGHRVAIELKDVAAVRNHLRKLGYLVES